jgi:hypothetical protein
MMSTLTRNYGKGVAAFCRQIRDHYQAHGTDLNDIMTATYPGNGAAVDSTANLLRAMVEDGLIIRADQPAPTLSQRAFAGLGSCHVENHYFYFRGPDLVQGINLAA